MTEIITLKGDSRCVCESERSGFVLYMVCPYCIFIVYYYILYVRFLRSEAFVRRKMKVL